jgi:hypothetical protein
VTKYIYADTVDHQCVYRLFRVRVPGQSKNESLVLPFRPLISHMGSIMALRRPRIQHMVTARRGREVYSRREMNPGVWPR